MSRYSTRPDDGRPDTSRTLTGLDIIVLEPREPHPQLPAISRDDQNTALADRRGHRILGLLEKDPTRLWRPRDIASHFGDNYGNHVSATLQMGRDRPDPQTRPRPLRRHGMDPDTPCMTCENVNYPALGPPPLRHRSMRPEPQGSCRGWRFPTRGLDAGTPAEDHERTWLVPRGSGSRHQVAWQQAMSLAQSGKLLLCVTPVDKAQAHGAPAGGVHQVESGTCG